MPGCRAPGQRRPPFYRQGCPEWQKVTIKPFVDLWTEPRAVPRVPRAWGRDSGVFPKPSIPQTLHVPPALTLELRRRARAMQSSCRSPTEKFEPFSTTSACRPCGNFEIYDMEEDARGPLWVSFRTDPLVPLLSCHDTPSLPLSLHSRHWPFSSSALPIQFPSQGLCTC